ncbi:LysM peptidoglycan-binding domain-containing protein [sulfur-oxidizing endosymbiont of Gigantopelta aegis]|uniref:LysM peptidoglycan-binding domain-containing protein n=1 Tax=sulfur-oxidizing endosymbiont of Gigantopelta aegis TaxID=2794934 RepID=UPI0018DB62AD|nr:LysM domain-containing protein [sulfur-oxidizing endosymbiont of Gigantopelta aegis]
MPVKKHIVKQGESLTSIAKKYGFNQYETIYKNAANDFFRNKRSNPEEIFLGDELFIPEKETKTEELTVKTDNEIIINKEKRFLNIELYDFFDQGQALADSPYTVVIGDKTFRGKLDASGKLSLEITNDDKQAELSFEVEDKAGVAIYHWTLDVAHLDPIETPTGIAQRLENMGCMDVDSDKFYSRSNKEANLHYLTIAWNALAHSLTQAMPWHDLAEGEQLNLTQEQFMVNSQNRDAIKTTNKDAQDLLNNNGYC